jgi:hypothetical protein
MIRRWRFEIASILRMYPRLYLPIARRIGAGEPFGGDTGFVMEGFPRSGNTFSSAAFGISKTSEWPHVAHHRHAPAQVIAAARRGIPALVLVRKPEEAILSFIIQQPHVTIRQALRAYARFYRPLLAYQDRFVVATFDEVMSDFGAVTRKVNDRFGTGFDVFEHSEENVRTCLDMIEEENRQRWGSGRDLELKGAFPTEARTRRKDELRAAYRAPGLRQLRADADRLYEAFAGLSARHEGTDRR